MNDKTIPFLQNYKEFANFLAFIVQERELWIGALSDAPVDKISQISGRILAYDQIIQATDAHRIIRLHERTT